MEEILSDFSIGALAVAAKLNFYAYFLRFPTGGSMSTQPGEGWHAWRTSLAHPWYNGVLAQLPAASMSDESIDDALRFFEGSGGVITWWLTPEAAVDPWRERLAARGFEYNADTPGMTIDLAALDSQAVAAPGLEIRTVASAVDMQEWVAVLASGFELPPQLRAACHAVFQELGYDLPICSYLGLVEGRPAATATLFLGAGVAGVMNVTTLPFARRRGIGAAMTTAALLDGRSLGYRIGVLQSSEQGFSVYSRMGFVEVCRMEHFFGRVLR